MIPESLWQEFIAKEPAYKGKSYDTFTFGDKPDELLRLVMCGEKTATSCIYRGVSPIKWGILVLFWILQVRRQLLRIQKFQSFLLIK